MRMNRRTSSFTRNFWTGVLAASLLAGASFSGNIASAVPNEFTYQGLLTLSSGAPILSNSVDVKVDIYDDPAAGSLLGTATFSGLDLSATKGLVNLAIPAAGLDLSGDLYLAVTVTDNNTATTEALTPRQKVGSVPFALSAGSVDGFDTANVVTVDGVQNIDGAKTFTTNVNVTGKVSQTGAPTTSSDLTTKSYVDNLVATVNGGGPGSNFVDTLSNQTINGEKTFTQYLEVNPTGVNTATSGEVNPGLGVRAVADPTAERAIGLRGRILAGTVEPQTRQIQGIVGAGNSAGGANTSISGGYFNGKLDGGNQGALLITGVSADAEVSGGGTGFVPGQALFGGRFGAAAIGSGDATAVGAVASALGAHSGPSAGLVAIGAESTTSNIGIVGASNATVAQLTTIIGTPEGIGVYAYNPAVDGTAIKANNKVEVDDTDVNTSTSGEQGASVSVRAVADPAAARAIGIRGRILADTVEAQTRGLQGVLGSVTSAGGDNTSISGGYFNGKVSANATNGALFTTGVSADAEAVPGATGFTSSQILVGGRFGAAGLDTGDAAAVGVIGTALGAHTGTSTGVLGLAGESTTANVGVLGAANATVPQLTSLVVSAPGVGVYAYNPAVGGDALYVNGTTTATGRVTLENVLRLTPTATDPDPAGALEGDIYLNKTGSTYTLRVFDGAAWQNL